MAVDTLARAMAAGITNGEHVDVDDLLRADLLHFEELDNTVQTVTYDSNGVVQKIEHTENPGGSIIRTDEFTFTDTVITEVRTLNTGESLTIITNLETLVTTVVYSA